MKILFVIHSSGKASGGHYHSLDQISRNLAKSIDLEIISFGTIESPVLSYNPYFKKHFNFTNRYELFKLKAAFRKYLNSSNPTHIHFFDTESLNQVLLINRLKGLPVILNKCGGPSPLRKKWQIVDELILFSKENYNWFLNNKSYHSDNLHLISNRVNDFVLAPIENRKDSSYINFIRITRIGGAYEKTLFDTFNLIERLMKTHRVKLLVVGRIQNAFRFDKIQREVLQRNLPVEFITDERASIGRNFLQLADFAIGTGRSLMESMSVGIPTLTPCSNRDEPILINNLNFDQMFKTNFSERNFSVDKFVDEQKRLNFLLLDKEAYQNSSLEMKSFFKKHFSIQNGTENYLTVYQKSRDQRIIPKKRSANFLYLLKEFKNLTSYNG